MRNLFYAGVAALGLTAGAVAIVNPVTAADHLEAPLVQLDGRTDINDIYAFQSPSDPDNTVLVLTVNPAAGVLSPTTFDPSGSYRLHIDTDGDAKKDHTVRIKFGEVGPDGRQSVRVAGDAGEGRGAVGEEVALDNGGRAIAGVFDDPFFFDFQAFQDQVKGAGGPRTFCDGHQTDFFAGLNVSAVVIEVPSEDLTDGSSTIGVWAETATEQGRVDRMGRPAIATVLIDDGSEDAFNKIRPHRDRAKFSGQVQGNLLALSGLDGSGYTEAEAEAITDVLLPDILTVDTASAAGFLNGRGLADDVIDTELFIVTGGLGANGSAVLDSDCIDGNDVPFSPTFPYLGEAH